MTHREMVIDILRKSKRPLTCAAICRALQDKMKITQYTSGSISSILAKLVKEKVYVEYGEQVGPKGGYTYKFIPVRE